MQMILVCVGIASHEYPRGLPARRTCRHRAGLCRSSRLAERLAAVAAGLPGRGRRSHPGHLPARHRAPRGTAPGAAAPAAGFPAGDRRRAAGGSPAPPRPGARVSRRARHAAGRRSDVGRGARDPARDPGPDGPVARPAVRPGQESVPHVPARRAPLRLHRPTDGRLGTHRQALHATGLPAMSRSAALKHASGSESVLDEAASWLALAQQRSLDAREVAELDAWRRHSEAHEKAWQAALELQRMFDGVPAEIGAEVLGRHRTDRRAVLKSLVALAFAAPAGYAAWLHAPRVTADYRTAVGERDDVALPDGSRLSLNTASAVRLEYSAEERRLVLVEGEILVSTVPDSAGHSRAFVVQTRHGTVRALGTRFTVRDLDDGRTGVTVFEHAVAVRPLGAAQAHRLDAGRRLDFDGQQVFPSTVHDEARPG